MKTGRTFFLMLVLCLLALAPVQVLAAAMPGIMMGGGAVTPGNIIVMANRTNWNVVLNETSTGKADGRLLMTANCFHNPNNVARNYWGYMDYMQDFFDVKFTSVEKSAVMSTFKYDPAGTYARIVFADSSLIGAKLFALSASEAVSYFSSGSDRLPGNWWLRSPLDLVNGAGCLDTSGSITSRPISYDGVLACRPAFNLNLSSVLFSSAAVGGKVSGPEGYAALYPIPANSSGRWKLTLLDSGRVFTAGLAATDSLTMPWGYDAWDLHLSYSGALTGSNEYVSALLCDSQGLARYYGHLAADSASGTVTLAMPVGLAVGTYTIRLFSEQCNDDNLTDFGSEFADISLTVTGERHTVTFDVMGIGETPAPQIVGLGDTVSETTVTPPVGYTFTGWYYRPDGSEAIVPFDFSMPITENITVYARWTYEQLRRLTVYVSRPIGRFTVTGSNGRIYAEDQSVDTYVPDGIALTLNITPSYQSTFSGSVSLGGSQQTTILSSAITSYDLGTGDATVMLDFEPLPVLSMNVTGSGDWTVTDGRGACYTDKSLIPLPSGETMSTDDMLTLTITPGDYGCDGSINNNGTITPIVDGVTTYEFFAAGPVTITLDYYDRSEYRTIRFHNEGCISGSQRVEARAGATATAPTATLDKAAYTSNDIFNGWNTLQTPTDDNPGAAYADKAQITLTGDVDLYAQWIQAWAVNFRENNGEGSMDRYRLPESETGASGTLPLCTFTRSGYAFTGWNNKANGSGAVSFADGAEITLTKNLTLYAQWAPAWTVSFDANGGEGYMSVLPVAKGQSAGLPACDYIREGYDFTGWAAAADGVAAFTDGAAITPADDMTLYAVWTPVTYSIIYELYGGSLPQEVTNPKTYTIESDQIQLQAPAKEGFVFAGWYADAEFTRQVSGIGTGSTGDKIFHAKWAELTLPAFGAPDFILPAGLTAIGAEAFEGIAASVVDIPAGCLSIGDHAFRGCAGLTQIRIPADCTLGTDVFDGCANVLIFSGAGSPAETYCLNHENCTFAEEAQN